MSSSPEAEQFVSVSDIAARAAGVSEQLVRDAVERGEIEGARRLGRRILIPKDALDRLPLVKKAEV